ncbi:MAG: hypothetical protein SFX73_36175 [Kofleriaceae bacterium]|nr:hypothetical protein [Kofleriaceae bacterium]
MKLGVVFGLLVAACGSESNSAVDAAPDASLDVDAPGIDAPPGPIRVTALRGGTPRAGTRVIVHDDDGAPVSDLVPDADGRISIDADRPRTITVAFAPEGPAGDRVLTFTVVAAAPGEQIVVDARLERPVVQGAITASYTLPMGTVGQEMDLGCVRRPFNNLVTEATVDIIETCPQGGTRFNALLTAVASQQPAAWALFEDQTTAADGAIAVSGWSTAFDSLPLTFTTPSVQLSDFSFGVRLALDGVWHDADETGATSLPQAGEAVSLRLPSGVGEAFHLHARAAFGPPSGDGPVVRKPDVTAHWLGTTPPAPDAIDFTALDIPRVYDLGRDPTDTTGRTLTWREEGTPAELAAVDGVTADLSRFASNVLYRWQVVAPHGATSSLRLPTLPDDLSARMPGTADHSIELALVRIAAGGGGPAIRAQAGGWVRTAFNARPPVDAAFTSVVSSLVLDE